MADLLDAVEAAYRDVAAGRDRSPLRSHVELADGSLLLMPGVREGGSGASVKLVTVMPGNAARGLPTIQALVVWFDAETGRPLAILDGGTITAMRTGAASGVGTRLLARTDAETLAVIGAGAQAEWQVRAVLAARPIRRVLVYARDAERREAFARAHGRGDGHRRRRPRRTPRRRCARPTSSAARRPRRSRCSTRRGCGPGAHVNGIGAFRLGMVELPPELFARAAVVAVDSHEAAMAEAGDVVAAIDAGFVAEADLVEIGTVERDWAATRDPEAITVFKSVGLAIQDVAAAELVVARAARPRASAPGGSRIGRVACQARSTTSRTISSLLASRRRRSRRRRGAAGAAASSRPLEPNDGVVAQVRAVEARAGQPSAYWRRPPRRSGLGPATATATTIGSGLGGGGGGGATRPTCPPPGMATGSGGGRGSASAPE